MEFRWLSELGPESALRKIFLGKLPEIAASMNYGSGNVLGYMQGEKFDCLICFEGKKFVGCCAADKRDKKAMAGWLIYTDPAFRHRGLANAISAEFFRRAQKLGFESARLGGGLPPTRQILESDKRNRKKLGLRGFNIEPMAGRVSFPRRKGK